MGGSSLAAQGAELVSDLRDSTALGVTDVATRACAIRRAYVAVARAARKRRARAALLVNYTEFNSLLAAHLHARDVRVLWYGAPQIWAWRRGRADRLRRNVDRMAVMLPFEEALWRDRGVDAEYVGHPASEAAFMGRAEAREALGLTPYARAVAIMPGSRPHEVDRLLRPMLEAYERVRQDRASIDGRVLLAPSLDAATRSARARRARGSRSRWSRSTGASGRRRAWERSTRRSALQGPRRSRPRSPGRCRWSSTASTW